MSNFRLVIVAPTWTPILEQLIQTTQDYYDISVLTKRAESLSFYSDKVEVLQCFDELSPWEVVKLAPWLLQKTPALYHFVLTENYSTKELMALSTLASLIRGIPRNTFSYSLNCYLDSWNRFLLKPLIENQTPLNIWGQTQLSHANSYSEHQSLQHSSNNSHLMSVRSKQNNYWYFPYTLATWSASQNVILETLFQLNPSTPVAIPNWGNYPLRKRHHWRHKFRDNLEKINMPFHVGFETITQNISVLILAGGSYLPWNESELIYIAQNQIPIIIDEEQAKSLEAPWVHGDQIWILKPNQMRENLLEFMNKQDSSLTYESIQNLSYFQDHRSNQLLRAFSEKFNLIE